MTLHTASSSLTPFTESIEKITKGVGHTVAWLLLFMVILESSVVILRYGFDLGSIALQESITYLHGTAFLLGTAYALQADEHVRVDIFYQHMTAKGKAWVNLLGSLFLLFPITVFIIWASLPYIAQAWSIKEASADAGGLAGLYLLKTMIILFAGLLMLQGLAFTSRL